MEFLQAVLTCWGVFIDEREGLYIRKEGLYIRGGSLSKRAEDSSIYRIIEGAH